MDIASEGLLLDLFDVKAEIGRRGGSLSAIAKAAKLDPSSCRCALRYPVPAANKAIADFLGLSVHDLWPEWFDEHGERRPDVSSAILRRRWSSQKRRAA
jgi:Ner family transcriptional regulator